MKTNEKITLAVLGAVVAALAVLSLVWFSDSRAAHAADDRAAAIDVLEAAVISEVHAERAADRPDATAVDIQRWKDAEQALEVAKSRAEQAGLTMDESLRASRRAIGMAFDEIRDATGVRRSGE